MKQLRACIFLLLCMHGLSCSQKTDKNNGLKFLGYIETLPTTQINNNSWTIGCEVLDRDYANYYSYNNYLPELGAKTARLQMGWAKCERQKGVYDFGWIKEIIIDLKARNILPWLQLSYGNTIYEGGGDPTLAGGMPYSQEALNAWDNWVKATVLLFKDYTNYWEVWNEPNLRNKHNTMQDPADYGKFFIRTAEIIRQIQPDAVISGLALCGMHEYSFGYIKSFLDYLKDADKLDLLNEITYHPYPPIPEETYPLAERLRSMLSEYSATIKIKHGETGCPSGRQISGPLEKYDWTETSQSKWLLRRMCGDYANNIPTSIFAIIDYSYPKTKSLYDEGYTIKMGLLAKDSLKQVSKIKPSFYAVRNAISIMNNKWQKTDDKPVIMPQKDFTNAEDIYACHFMNRQSGKDMLIAWVGNKIPGNSMQKTLVDLSVRPVHFEEPAFIDLLDGKVFSIYEKNLKMNNDTCVLSNIPIYDSPVIITEKSEISITKQLKKGLNIQ